MKAKDIPPWLFGFVFGFAVVTIVLCFDSKASYKRGQTDAMYGNWHYARAKDANGNEYVVEVPEKR